MNHKQLKEEYAKSLLKLIEKKEFSGLFLSFQEQEERQRLWAFIRGRNFNEEMVWEIIDDINEDRINVSDLEKESLIRECYREVDQYWLSY